MGEPAETFERAQFGLLVPVLWCIDAWLFIGVVITWLT